jgi:ribose transport system permease protein
MKKELGIGLLLLVLCTTVAIINPQFLGAANFQNTARLIGIYGIFSIGLGIVIITGGIDLSVGSFFALQGVLFCMAVKGELRHPQWFEAFLTRIHLWNLTSPLFTCLDGHVWSWPTALAFAILGATLLGALHGFLVTKVKLQPFIVTLCGLLIYRGIARFTTDDNTKGLGMESFGLLEKVANSTFIQTLNETFHIKIPNLKIGSVSLYAYDVPNAFILLLFVAVVMWIVLHRSVYGRYLYAVGRNEEAARFSGINNKLVIGSAYAVGMALAGISGILLVFYVPSISPASHGQAYELYGIAAAVLGGCSLRGGEGSILGIILGTILLQVLQNLVILLGIPSSLNLAVLGGVILLGVTLDQVLGQRKKGDSKFNWFRQTRVLPQGTEAGK